MHSHRPIHKPEHLADKRADCIHKARGPLRSPEISKLGMVHSVHTKKQHFLHPLTKRDLQWASRSRQVFPDLPNKVTELVRYCIMLLQWGTCLGSATEIADNTSPCKQAYSVHRDLLSGEISTGGWCCTNNLFLHDDPAIVSRSALLQFSTC